MGVSYVGVTEGFGKNIATHEISEGGVTKHIGRDAPGAGVLTLPGTPQIDAQSTAGTKSGNVDVQGKGRIVCKISYSANNVEATWRVYFKDSAGALILATEELSVANLGVADGTRYLGAGIVLANEVGAASVELELVTAPTNSGDASAWVTGV